MNFFTTPYSERLHITFFGKRNSGKSTLINAITNQELSVVSPKAGTTTDPVSKAMEILPLGPVILTDTPGYDDIGDLGKLRVKKTIKTLDKTDIAILVCDINKGLTQDDYEFIDLFKEKNISFLVALNKCDTTDSVVSTDENTVIISATKKLNLESIFNFLKTVNPKTSDTKKILNDLIKKDDIVVLVTPIDASAPKSRLILPQQQTIRDILDSNAIVMQMQDDELKSALSALKTPPSLVITDSQVFPKVEKIVPKSIPLTSFSILMARYKGFLEEAISGAYTLDTLRDGDKILICEGCTHHKKCDDIGNVKLPDWIRNYTKKDLCIENISGSDFPEDLTTYKLVIHCGGCMLTKREISSRQNISKKQNIPFTNYGIIIAHINKILARSIEVFDI